MKCNICQTDTTPIFQGIVLSKYQTQYYGCPRCGFLQTDPPHWLAEAYTQPINRSDVGYVARNVAFTEFTTLLLSSCFPRCGPCVDFGGGYGMFVRLMRDRGYNFYRQDKFCPNLFAADFEAPNDPAIHYDFLTAFEVFEHLNDPVCELEKMLRMSDHILFSTEAVPLPYPPLDQWAYYGLEHGQHIAFYPIKTLQFLAERYQMFLYSSPDRSVHFFSRRAISRFRWSMMFRRGSRWLIKHLVRQPPSLLMPDYHRVTAMIRNTPV